MKAILLIGGFGTRLRPFTLSTPKPLLPVVNRPFLKLQIDQLKSQGIREIILCTAYRPQAFRREFGDGRSLGVRLRYVHESSPMGTGGAIRNAKRYIDGTTLICNGDILMALDVNEFLRFHRQHQAAVSLALTRVKDPTAYGLITTNHDGRVTQFLEKPSSDQVTTDTINAGFYLFEHFVIGEIASDRPVSVEREVFPNLLKEGFALAAKVFDGYWLDMGTVEKYRQANIDALAGQFPAKISGKRTSWGWSMPGARVHRTAALKGPVLLGKNVTIGKNAEIIGPTVIGEGSHIEDRAIVQGSILHEMVRIEANAVIRDSVIGSFSHIGANVLISEGSALASRTRIGDFSKL